MINNRLQTSMLLFIKIRFLVSIYILFMVSEVWVMKKFKEQNYRWRIDDNILLRDNSKSVEITKVELDWLEFQLANQTGY